jgi:protease PrsW
MSDTPPRPVRLALTDSTGPTRRRDWDWAAVLGGGSVLWGLVYLALRDTHDAVLIPSLILIGAAIAPMTLITFIADRAVDHDATVLSVALTATVGGFIGVSAAAVLEYQTGHRLQALPMTAVAIIEEAAKLICPALAVRAVRNRRPSTGLILGVASGAGFAVLETMGYASVSVVQSHGNIAALNDVLLLRGLTSPATHMAWTGLTAAALWAATDRGWTRATTTRFAATFILAVCLHTAWDSQTGRTSSWSYAALAVVSVALLARTVGNLQRPEQGNGDGSSQRSPGGAFANRSW